MGDTNARDKFEFHFLHEEAKEASVETLEAIAALRASNRKYLHDKNPAIRNWAKGVQAACDSADRVIKESLDDLEKISGEI